MFIRHGKLFDHVIAPIRSRRRLERLANFMYYPLESLPQFEAAPLRYDQGGRSRAESAVTISAFARKRGRMTTSSQESDWAVWMRAAMTGDAGAYRQLLVSLAPRLRAVARSRCRSLGALEDEIEDLVQEVLLTIHLKRGTWDQSRPIGPWVAAITRNKLVDVLRRRGRHITVPIEDFVDSLQAEDHAPELPSREIDSLLARLTPHQREIVRSISLNGSSIRETADRLQMTEGAVRVTLHRALRTLAVFYRRSASED